MNIYAQAGTSIKMFMTKLLALTPQASKMFDEEMKSKGENYSTAQLSKDIRSDINMTMSKLSKLFMSGTLEYATVQKMVGARHAPQISQLLVELGGDMEGYTRRVVEGRDVAEDSKKAMESWSSELKRLDNNFRELNTVLLSVMDTVGIGALKLSNAILDFVNSVVQNKVGKNVAGSVATGVGSVMALDFALFAGSIAKAAAKTKTGTMFTAAGERTFTNGILKIFSKIGSKIVSLLSPIAAINVGKLGTIGSAFKALGGPVGIGVVAAITALTAYAIQRKKESREAIEISDKISKARVKENIIYEESLKSNAKATNGIIDGLLKFDKTIISTTESITAASISASKFAENSGIMAKTINKLGTETKVEKLFSSAEEAGSTDQKIAAKVYRTIVEKAPDFMKEIMKNANAGTFKVGKEFDLGSLSGLSDADLEKFGKEIKAVFKKDYLRPTGKIADTSEAAAFIKFMDETSRIEKESLREYMANFTMDAMKKSNETNEMKQMFSSIFKNTAISDVKSVEKYITSEDLLIKILDQGNILAEEIQYLEDLGILKSKSDPTKELAKMGKAIDYFEAFIKSAKIMINTDKAIERYFETIKKMPQLSPPAVSLDDVRSTRNAIDEFGVDNVATAVIQGITKENSLELTKDSGFTKLVDDLLLSKSPGIEKYRKSLEEIRSLFVKIANGEEQKAIVKNTQAEVDAMIKLRKELNNYDRERKKLELNKLKTYGVGKFEKMQLENDYGISNIKTQYKDRLLSANKGYSAEKITTMVDSTVDPIANSISDLYNRGFDVSEIYNQVKEKIDPEIFGDYFDKLFELTLSNLEKISEETFNQNKRRLKLGSDSRLLAISSSNINQGAKSIATAKEVRDSTISDVDLRLSALDIKSTKDGVTEVTKAEDEYVRISKKNIADRDAIEKEYFLKYEEFMHEKLKAENDYLNVLKEQKKQMADNALEFDKYYSERTTDKSMSFKSDYDLLKSGGFKKTGFSKVNAMPSFQEDTRSLIEKYKDKSVEYKEISSKDADTLTKDERDKSEILEKQLKTIKEMIDIKEKEKAYYQESLSLDRDGLRIIEERKKNAIALMNFDLATLKTELAMAEASESRDENEIKAINNKITRKDDEIKLAEKQMDSARKNLSFESKIFDMQNNKDASKVELAKEQIAETQRLIDSEEGEIEKLTLLNKLEQDRLNLKQAQNEQYSKVLDNINSMTSGESIGFSVNNESVANAFRKVGSSGVKADITGTEMSEVAKYGVKQISNLSAGYFSKQNDYLSKEIELLEQKKSFLTDEEEIAEMDRQIKEAQLKQIDVNMREKQASAGFDAIGGMLSGAVVAATNPIGLAMMGLSAISGIFSATKAKEEAKQAKFEMENAEAMKNLATERNEILKRTSDLIDGVMNVSKKGGTGFAFDKFFDEINVADTTGGNVKQTTYHHMYGGLGKDEKFIYGKDVSVDKISSTSDLTKKIESIQAEVKILEDLIPSLDAARGKIKKDAFTGTIIKNISTEKSKELNKASETLAQAEADLINLKNMEKQLLGYEETIENKRNVMLSQHFGFRIEKEEETNKYIIKEWEQRYDTLTKMHQNAMSGIREYDSSEIINNLAGAITVEDVGVKDVLDKIQKTFLEGSKVYKKVKTASGLGIEVVIENNKSIKDLMADNEFLKDGDLTSDAKKSIDAIAGLYGNLSTEQARVTDSVMKMAEYWAETGGTLSDIIPMMGEMATGLQEAMYDSLRAESFADSFNTLGQFAGEQFINQFIENSLNEKFKDKFTSIYSSLNDVINNGLSISAIAGIRNELATFSAQTAAERQKIKAITSMLTLDQTIDYSDNSDKIEYSGGSSKSVVYNFNVSNAFSIGNVVGDDTTMTKFANTMTPFIIESIKAQLK